MAQLERYPRQVHVSRPSHHAPPSLEKATRGGEYWNGLASPTSPGLNSPISEEESLTPRRKSMFSIVKEKAKKFRRSLSKKRHDDADLSPTWVTFNVDHHDEVDADAEFLGAPMYESEMAPEAYKENARQHPRATPVIADNHVLSNPSSPTSISSQMQGLTINSKPLDARTPAFTPQLSCRRSPLSVKTTASPQTPSPKALSKLSPVSSSKASRFSSAPSTPRKSLSPTAPSMKNAAADQTWDKGVSVREYFKTKLEPGEDEKALSQVISDVMTPTKTSGDVGVMDKVREAVSSLLRNEESSQYSVRSPTVRVSSSSHTPLLSATNVQQVNDEEKFDRILQPN